MPGNCSDPDFSVWLTAMTLVSAGISRLDGSRVASVYNYLRMNGNLMHASFHFCHASNTLGRSHNVHSDKAGLLDQTTLDTLNALFITLSKIHYCVNIH